MTNTLHTLDDDAHDGLHGEVGDVIHSLRGVSLPPKKERLHIDDRHRMSLALAHFNTIEVPLR